MKPIFKGACAWLAGTPRAPNKAAAAKAWRKKLRTAGAAALEFIVSPVYFGSNKGVIVSYAI
jgi:hypothetical protein